MKNPCGNCQGRLQRQEIAQDFARDGVKVRLSGLSAWVCQGCGEVYVEPEDAQKMFQAVNSLFALALLEKPRKEIVTAQLS